MKNDRKCFDIWNASAGFWREGGGKKIEASISAMMYTSMTRLCPKYIKKEITDVKEKLWKIYKIKRWKKVCLM